MSLSLGDPRRVALCAVVATALVGLAAPARAESGSYYDSWDDDMRLALFEFDTHFALAPNGEVMIEPGFDVNVTIRPGVGVGLGISGGASGVVTGRRSGVSFTPSAEAFHNIDWLQVYGRAGVPIQSRSGAGLDGSRGLAVFGAAGARLRAGHCPARNAPEKRYYGEDDEGERIADALLPACMTFGVEVRMQYNAVGGYLMTPAVMPAGTSVLSTAFTIGYEL